jgi:hypothetical protein
MKSPTIHPLVTGVFRAYWDPSCSRSLEDDKQLPNKKEPQPNHPVQKLLNKPNGSPVACWLDATSLLLRYDRTTINPMRLPRWNINEIVDGGSCLDQAHHEG